MLFTITFTSGHDVVLHGFPSVDVHCEGSQGRCSVTEPLNIHEPTALNFIDADKWNLATHFKLSSSSSNVSILPYGIFHRFTFIEQIVIKCSLKSIHKEDFENADKLEVLDMDDNEIEILSSHVFEHVNNLQEIYVSNNRLNSIENFAFNGLTQLLRIFLQNNSLTVIKANTFSNAKNIKSIELQNNLIEIIEDGAFNLQFLSDINLASNRLQTISDSAFVGVSLTDANLHELDVSSNKLSNADILKDLKRIPGLVTLKLEDNYFRELHEFDGLIERFPNLTSIWLTRNNFTCEILQTIVDSLEMQVISVQVRRDWFHENKEYKGVSCL